MAHRQITCINKIDRLNPHERIRIVGGSWGRISVDQCIRDIETNLHSYFVRKDNKEVDVEVKEHEGRKFIKTTADGFVPNNLSELDECK